MTTILRAETDKPIFISYSRANRAFADNLRADLTALGFKVWRDVHDMAIGNDWWRQIQQAIDSCETTILCVSPGALASPVVKQEWHYAREQGKRVMPIIADDVDFNAVPRWMKRVDWADFREGKPEREAVWARFIHQLNTPHIARKVPFMVDPLPADFVARPGELEPLVTALVDDTHGAVALTAALKGAGGYGKTTLARAICHDLRVRGAFDDGVLWVTLGEKLNEDQLREKVLDLVVKLRGVRPPVATLEASKDELRKSVADQYLLLVIDDAWQMAHLEPFLKTGANAATLITTRNRGVLPSDCKTRDVDAMRSTEAVQLLSAGLFQKDDTGKTLIPSEIAQQLANLASRLGEWALLLKLANGALRRRVDQQEPLSKALDWVEKALARKGLDALTDPNNPKERNRAAAASLGVSIELLANDEQAQFRRLAIFPEDVDVPLAALEKLWSLDDFDTETRCERLFDLSLLLNYDLSARTIRLHDVVRTYLRESHKTDLTIWNTHFLDAYQVVEWHTLPPTEPYLWRWLAYHLVDAGRADTLRALLLDFRYLQAKLDATDATTLLLDYGLAPEDDTLRLLRSALTLSLPALEADKRQLASQLWGRLFSHHDKPEIAIFVGSLQYPHPSFMVLDTPLNATHTQAGGPLLRTLAGHTRDVNGALQLSDGRLLSWSDDHTLRLWSAEGQALATLAGHTGFIDGAQQLGDGRLLSWSRDGTLRLWSAEGQALTILKGHTSGVQGAQQLGDGRLLSWSYDHTLRLWSAEGQALATLAGHTGFIDGAQQLGDGRLLSWSRDGTLRLWSVEGQALATLAEHTGFIDGAQQLGDGRLLSWSYDHTLRLWSAEGQALATLAGHTRDVNGALQLGDGRLLSWSTDGTLRLWSAEGQALATMAGHTRDVNGALQLSDRRLLSWADDNTLRLWNADGEPLAAFYGDAPITCCAVMRQSPLRVAIGDQQGRVLFLDFVE